MTALVRLLISSAYLVVARIARTIRSMLHCGYPAFTSMEDLLLEGRSVVRWGDGESSLLLMKSIAFQKSSPRLAVDLCRVLVSPRKPYVLCMPSHLQQYPDHLRDARYRTMWARTIFVWELLSWRFGHSVSDAHAFRREAANRQQVMDLVFNTCDVRCIVSKNPADAESVSAVVKRRVLHVQCPGSQAYEELGTLRNRLLQALQQLPDREPVDGPSRKLTVLLGAGPAGKVLIGQLSGRREHRDIQFLDVGHMFDHGIPR